MSSIDALGAQIQHPVAAPAPPQPGNQPTSTSLAPRDPTRVPPAFQVSDQPALTAQSVVVTRVLESAEKPEADNPMKTEVPLIGEVTDAQARALEQAQNRAETPLSFVEKVAIISAVGAPGAAPPAPEQAEGAAILGRPPTSPAAMALDVTR